MKKIKSYKESKSYRYALDVLSGKILASKYIKKQAIRYLADLKRADLYFDLDWWYKLNVFFEEILYVEELRKPSPVLPPHSFWLEQLHCLRRKDTGFKKYTFVYCQFARKQAKTFMAAGNALFELLVGADPSPHIMCGANSREQAIYCTNMMGKLVRNSPELRDIWDQNSGELRIHRHAGNTHKVLYLTDERDGHIIAMPKDPGDGGNPSLTIIDEFHEAKNLSLLETMSSGQGLRTEPLVVVITSPGVDKSAPCYTVLRKKATDVLDGHIDDDYFLPIMFELDDESEWKNIDMLIKSNPCMPYMPTLKPFLIKRIKEAQTLGGEMEAFIKIKNCGIWVDAAKVWIQHETVIKNNHGITDEELIGKDCYTGLDLSKGEDLNAFVMFFPNVRPGIHAVKSMFWIPEDKVNDNKDLVDYRKWVQMGLMIKQEGNTAQHVLIARDILNEISKYNVVSFGYDAKYAIMAILPMMEQAGYEEKLVPVGQGFTLSPAVVQCTDMMKKHELDLMGNEVLYWNFSNTVMKIGDQGDPYPSKVKSQNKIDGVSALLTGMTEYFRLNAEPEYKPFVITI